MKLIDVFRFADELLYEWWEGQKLQRKKMATKIVNDWIDKSTEKIIETPELFGDIELDSVKNPSKTYDDFLRYILAFCKGSVSDTNPIIIDWTIRNCKFPIKFILKPGSVVGGGQSFKTLGKNEVDRVEIFVPVKNFTYIKQETNEGSRFCYKMIEDLVAHLNEIVHHELTHCYQFLDGEDVYYFGTNLESWKNVKCAGEIYYHLYNTRKHELRAAFDEAYNIYLRQGNKSQFRIRNKTTKTFFRCLAYAFANRSFHAKSFIYEYLRGSLSFEQFLSKLPEPTKLLYLYVFYVYGPSKDNKKAFRDLLETDPDSKLLDNESGNSLKTLVEDNHDNIRYAFGVYSDNPSVQSAFVKLVEAQPEEKLKKFSDELFSTTKDNNKLCEKIMKWGENASRGNYTDTIFKD